MAVSWSAHSNGFTISVQKAQFLLMQRFDLQDLFSILHYLVKSDINYSLFIIYYVLNLQL